MDRQIDHLIVTARLAIDLLPTYAPEGKDIARRLELAIDEVIRTKAKQDYIKSSQERGIPTPRSSGREKIHE